MCRVSKRSRNNIINKQLNKAGIDRSEFDKSINILNKVKREGKGFLFFIIMSFGLITYS